MPVIANLVENKEILVPTKICCIVNCCVCEKYPVLVIQLPSYIFKYIKTISKECFFSCGSQLPITEGSSYIPVVQEGINCSSPLAFAYYSAKKFKSVCAHYGNDYCTVDQDLKEQF